MIRAAIYMRVSSDKQAKEGDSIPAQRDALRKYIHDRADMVLAGEYLDDGISGTRSDRDELCRLLEDVEKGKIDVVLFTKLDRWFRSVRHYTATQEILDRHHVGWTAIWEPIYDTTTPAGRLIVNQMMSIAQFEAENTGQRIRQVQAYKKTKGEVISGSCPPGYMIQNKHMVPSEAAGSVREAFRTYSRTGNLNATVAACSGLPGLPRTQYAFKKMLTNRTYIGERYGNPAFCEPIVDRDLFNTVQILIPKNVRSSQKHTYIFSGLIRCAECGLNMAGNIRRRRRGNGKEEVYIQYRCPGHYTRKPATCGNTKLIYEHLLEQQLVGQIVELMEGEILTYEIEALPQRDRSDQIRALERKISRLKELYINELIDLSEYKRDKDALEAQLEQLKAEQEAPPRDLSALKEALSSDIEELYWTFTPAERRRFWRGILREISWDKERNVNVCFL